MGAWTFDRVAYPGGKFQLVINKVAGGQGSRDVSVVRGAPTSFDSYSDADPFGDSTAQFSFPSITPFDDLDASDIGVWLGYYSNVDLYWLPSQPANPHYFPLSNPVINALTNLPDVVTPIWSINSSGVQTGVNRIKIWEGFLTSMDFTADESSAMLQISCQGALFQLDRYLQKPFFPAQPWPLELLIADAFNNKNRPPLRLSPLKTQFPAAWKLKVPPYTGTTAYTSVAKPGTLWTGYSSRQTGSWDHTLTGFVQDQLAVMLTDKRSGVTTGNQWTVQHQHETPTTPGRQPVLLVRDRNRAPDFSVWLGTPGVTVRLSGDSTQSENVVYGDGTGVDGTVWRNAVISSDGSRTDYLPLAASRDVYPSTENPAFVKGTFLSEAYTKFGTGFDQPDAVSSAAQSLERDRNPGWSGSITLSVDPSELLPRWLIRAGMTVLLKGFAGSGDTGVPFHISARSANPMSGTVELTVDSRYRDLLTVEEAQARTRDPLTPVKMLQVNRTSVMIEDLLAPWDYTAGSGFIPREGKALHANRPRNQPFPYISWVQQHPPLHYPSWYVKCQAHAPKRTTRWAGPIQIITSEKDTITRSEFFCVDVYGRPVKAPFHVSLYYFNVTAASMPRNANGPDPYLDGAFEKQMKDGKLVAPLLQPDDSLIIGWGNRSDGVLNRAGFSPGRESSGSLPTGQLADDAAWSYDNTTYAQFFKANNPPGAKAKASDISLYAMFYCEWSTTVYFSGRLYRQNPGTS